MATSRTITCLHCQAENRANKKVCAKCGDYLSPIEKITGTPPKTERNSAIFSQIESGASFSKVARMFDLSIATTRQIYFRKKKRTKRE